MIDETPAPPVLAQISLLLQAWDGHDPAARDALVPIVYDELHRLAHHYMRSERHGHTLQTTALVNEAYLRLVDVPRMAWRDRAHFFAMAATMMRRILVDHARAHARDKRGGGVIMTSLDENVAAPGQDLDVIALDEALERLARIDERQARLVELRYFAGLTIEESAEALGISSGTVKREWAIAKAWLYRELHPAMTGGAAWPRVKEILSGALELAAPERTAYVVHSCGDDSELRREVESLLTAHQDADTFLEVPARLIPTGPPDLTGRTIGHYTIVRRLGAGGMGEVYLATDAKLDRPVALKLLSRELALNAARLRRFHAEARAASSLNHPHILVIHDFGELDGRPFIVSEYVEGETVRQRLERGALPMNEAIAVALQIAAALGAAHARGLVHRDIKPENVMLRPDGYAKVLDFGLAKLVTPDDQPLPDGGTGTVPGLVMGTPRYMSPEQARGKELDARSDIWSLGVLLYEMVTGRAPFAGATPADTIGAIVSVEPVPLGIQAPHAPPQLERIVAAALKKNRLDRPAAMSDVIADLTALSRQLDAGEPDIPAPPGLIAQPETSSTPRSRAAARTRLIVMPFRLLRPDAEIDFLAFSLADAIATTLSSLDSMIVRSSMTAARFTADPIDLQAIAAAAQVDAVLTGTLLRVGSQLRVSAQLLTAPDGTIVWSERIDVPLENVMRVQDELGERIADSLALPLTPRDQEALHRGAPASPRAYELYLRGNNHFYDAEQWTVARDLFVECVTEDPGFAPAWARLGRCYRLTAKFRSKTIDDVRENLKRAEVSFRKAFELNPDLPIAHHLYTNLETDLGRGEEAVLRLVRRARQRRADPDLFAGLVHACRYCGLLEASVAAHVRARQLDPHIATSVGPTYWMLGEFEQALEQGFSGFFVGVPQVSLGRELEAIAVARASAEVVRDPTTRSYQSVLPLLLEGRFEECRRILDELAPRNPDPESVYHIARTYARLGATDAALAQFDRAVDMGFLGHQTFARDPWLQPLQSQPRFLAALARARRRHDEAARKFRDAGGERLLGLG